MAYNQYLELDVGSRVREPNHLRFEFINQFAVNTDTYGNLNIWGKIMHAKTSFKRGTHLSFHMFASQTIVYRNWSFEDHFSTISKILNPTSGTLKASILYTHPITLIKSSKTNFSSRFGGRWMTTNISEKSFLSHHLHLGISIQQKIKERKWKDAIYIVLYPHYVVNFINEEDTMAHL